MVETIMSWAVIGYLDEISLEYSVKSNFSIPIDLLNHTERRINPIYDADVIFQFVISEQIQTLGASWWYQYQFVFHCFYGNADTRKVGHIVKDADMLRVVKQNLNQYLREGVELVNLFELRQLSYGVLGLAVEDPRYADVPFQDGPPTQPPTLVPTYAPISIDFDSNGTVKPTFEAENQTAIVGDKFDGPLPDSTYTMYTLPVDVNTWVCLINVYILFFFLAPSIFCSHFPSLYGCTLLSLIFRIGADILVFAYLCVQ
jgi:hypothetical protein